MHQGSGDSPHNHSQESSGTGRSLKGKQNDERYCSGKHDSDQLDRVHVAASPSGAGLLWR
jgi:hypothetical protein